MATRQDSEYASIKEVAKIANDYLDWLGIEE